MKKSVSKAFAALAGVLMLLAASCSSDGGSSGGTPDTGSTVKTGTVDGVTVTVDGTIYCSTCGKSYQTMAEAKACEHYKCDKCGTVYTTEDDLAACTSHVTVNFVDSAAVETTVTYTIKSGNTVTAPSWTKENAELSWTSSVDGVSVTDALSSGEGGNVASGEITFTSKWTSYVACSECGEHCADQDAAEAHALADKTCDECGTVCESKTAAEAHALADKTCDECGTVCESKTAAEAHALADKTCDTCGTVYASKAEADACTSHVTVTFTDSDGTNADVTKTIKSGATVTAPSWTKTNYTLSWTSSVDGLTAASEITSDVTFTSVWTEKPKCSNCGTYYDTTAEAEACGKQDGCPNYGKVLSWTAGDDSPSWLTGLSGTVTTSSSYIAYGLKSYVTIAASGTFTVTPLSACNIKVYIAGNNNTANKGTVTATVDGTKVGEAFSLPGRKDTTATPMTIAVTSDYVGKTFTFTTTYASFVYKVSLDE